MFRGLLVFSISKIFWGENFFKELLYELLLLIYSSYLNTILYVKVPNKKIPRKSFLGTFLGLLGASKSRKKGFR